MKKIMKISAMIFVLVTFLLLHSTPQAAIITHVSFMGYPKEAFTSKIEEYEFLDKIDENTFGKLHPDAKIYVLSNPPFEKATGGELDTYKVRKVGFFYFAEFYVHI